MILYGKGRVFLIVVMKRQLKRLSIIAMACCVIQTDCIATRAEASSGDNSNSVYQDASAFDEMSGFGYDFLYPTPTPDPLDSKEEVVSGDYSYKVLDDGTAIIIHYLGNGGSIKIPGTIDGYSVTALGDGSFNQCNITSVTLPDSLTLIGADALGCNKFKKVTIPKNVTYVDIGAFVGNQELVSVTVLSSSTEFGYGVFEFCSYPTLYAPKGSGAETYAINESKTVSFSATSSSLAAPGSFVVKKASETSIKCTWKAVSGASGYRVYYSTSAKGKFKLAGSTTTGLKLSKSSLKSGNTYYFKVRAYKVIEGKKIYGKFTSILKVKL